ncbi:MAG TPA: hypothetical protein VKA27_07410, partial [Sunxiuqinia sp.]|nr:hypothetical protein [Sunxiuqinia sp.]
MKYYHEQYETCRSEFRKATGQLKDKYNAVQTRKIIVPSQTDSDLTVDWCYLPAQKRTEKLLTL